MNTKDPQKRTDRNRSGVSSPSSVSRRAMLKGTVASMPAILTLQSGAAYARSSNLISRAPFSNDRHGRTLCLDLDSVEPVGDSHTYDLGEPPRAHVVAIKERDYRALPRSDSRRISEEQLCEKGGTAYYRDRNHNWRSDTGGGSDKEKHSADSRRAGRGWKQVRARQGVLVSATALSSFAGNIVVTDL